MTSRLRPTNEDFVWEPCAGGGDLIDGTLKLAPEAQIWASEIDQDAAARLREKYKAQGNITVAREDALEVGHPSLFDPRPPFTRVIANPPYGAYQSTQRRAALKKRFPHLYVRESYGVMLYHALSLLQPHGRLVFIVPDTFLWLHRHEGLRRTLLSESTIEEVALFPSKFFPGVKFGYSGLCVLTAVKARPALRHKLRIVDRLYDSSVLLELARSGAATSRCSMSELVQTELQARDHAALVRPSTNGGMHLGNRAVLTLEDLAEVRTGFYSGNDRCWIRRADGHVPRSKRFSDVDRHRVFRRGTPSLEGISGIQCFIPVLRGGAGSFVRPTRWYVDWSVEAVAEYKRPGKNPARFQNSQFYFQDGIGVPMVASARLTGALLERRLFDQGIVGVFPRDRRLFHFLVGFLNTELATRLVRQINPTANNSANYLKRLPVVRPNASELDKIDVVVGKAVHEARESGSVKAETLAQIESLYDAIWCGNRRPGRKGTAFLTR